MRLNTFRHRDFGRLTDCVSSPSPYFWFSILLHLLVVFRRRRRDPFESKKQKKNRKLNKNQFACRRRIIRMWPAYSASVGRSDTRWKKRPSSSRFRSRTSRRLDSARSGSCLLRQRGLLLRTVLDAYCGGRKWRIQFTVRRFYDLLSTPRLPNAPSL